MKKRTLAGLGSSLLVVGALIGQQITGIKASGSVKAHPNQCTMRVVVLQNPSIGDTVVAKAEMFNGTTGVQLRPVKVKLWSVTDTTVFGIISTTDSTARLVAKKIGTIDVQAHADCP